RRALRVRLGGAAGAGDEGLRARARRVRGAAARQRARGHDPAAVVRARAGTPLGPRARAALLRGGTLALDGRGRAPARADLARRDDRRTGLGDRTPDRRRARHRGPRDAATWARSLSRGARAKRLHSSPARSGASSAIRRRAAADSPSIRKSAKSKPGP